MKAAVIGAGIMGCGIVQVFAQNIKTDYVWLVDTDVILAETGKQRISNSLHRLVGKGKIDQSIANEILGKIIPCEKKEISKADIVIEAIEENINIKKKVFQELDGIVKEKAVFATNTSSLSITEISMGLSHDFIGMHFFNPAPVMKLVEIITTERTNQNVIEFAKGLARDLGKTPVEVREAPGFVVNRVLIPMINEAISIYAEGVASIEDIDSALKLGANHPMGPLELGDLIGLDVVLAILEVMLKETGNSRYLPQPMLKKMVREKKLGRKTGEGFYKY